MPLKIDSAMPIVKHNRTHSILFKKDKPKNFITYHGNNIMQGSHFNSWYNFVFKVLDTINPIIKKYPNFGARLIKLGEKIINRADDLKK